MYIYLIYAMHKSRMDITLKVLYSFYFNFKVIPFIYYAFIKIVF